MIGALPRGKSFWMLWIQIEPVAAVLQGKAAALRHNAGAESQEVAVDEGTGIPLSVCYAEIDRIPAREAPNFSWKEASAGPAEIDEPGAFP